MAIIVSSEEARKRRAHHVTPQGVGAWVQSYMGKNNVTPDSTVMSGRTGSDLTPVAILAEQDPHSNLRAHFHQADQFQVVFPCDGKFGTQAIDQCMVHFARAFSAYGPLVAGDEVLSYYTLRNSIDAGVRFMPESRDEIKRHGRKPFSVHATFEAIAEQPIETRQQCALIPPDATGLLATRHDLLPGTELSGSDPSQGRGQYWLVLAGGCMVDGVTLGAASLCFIDPQEAALALRALERGVSVLEMQFPR